MKAVLKEQLSVSAPASILATYRVAMYSGRVVQQSESSESKIQGGNVMRVADEIFVMAGFGSHLQIREQWMREAASMSSGPRRLDLPTLRSEQS